MDVIPLNDLITCIYVDLTSSGLQTRIQIYNLIMSSHFLRKNADRKRERERIHKNI